MLTNLKTEWQMAKRDVELAQMQISNAEPEYVDAAIYQLNSAYERFGAVTRELKRYATP